MWGEVLMRILNKYLVGGYKPGEVRKIDNGPGDKSINTITNPQELDFNIAVLNGNLSKTSFNFGEYSDIKSEKRSYFYGDVKEIKRNPNGTYSALVEFFNPKTGNLHEKCIVNFDFSRYHIRDGENGFTRKDIYNKNLDELGRQLENPNLATDPFVKDVLMRNKVLANKQPINELEANKILHNYRGAILYHNFDNNITANLYGYSYYRDKDPKMKATINQITSHEKAFEKYKDAIKFWCPEKFDNLINKFNYKRESAIYEKELDLFGGITGPWVGNENMQ